MKHLYVGVIVPLAVLLPLVFAVINWKKNIPGTLLIFVYLLAGGITNLAMKLMAMQKTNNLPLIHLFCAVEFLLVSEFYRVAFGKPANKMKFRLLQASFVLLCLINAKIRGIYTFNAFPLAIEALVLMLLAVIYFAKLFTSFTEEKITSLAGFWFNSGFFLYFAGSFIFNLFSNYILLESKAAFNVVLNLRVSFVLLMYLLFTFAFVKCKK